MASSSSQLLFVFVAIAAMLAPSALATVYIVGDDQVWDTGVNYTAWAQGKTFYVGDSLLFKYPEGSHNVYKVNGSLFQNCTVPTDVIPFTTGNDTVPLSKTGKKWYICGKEGHCGQGQKLVITVLSMAPGHSPLPSETNPPPPPSGAAKAAVFGHFGFIAVVFGILGMMM